MCQQRKLYVLITLHLGYEYFNTALKDILPLHIPKKLKIRKFQALEVRRNEVARLPCAGLPDVIPGPPKICFEKLGSAECLGSNPSRGFQIFL